MFATVRWSAVAAALIAVAIGVSESVHGLRHPLREPIMAPVVAPLLRAPLDDGARVLLALPGSLPPPQAQSVLFEVAWQRPEVYWSLVPEWPRGVPPDALVTIGSAKVPPGWRQHWRDGTIAVWVPAR